MSKLEEYAKITEIRKEMFKDCMRTEGLISMGPTNRGGIWLKLGEKELFNDVSIKDLESIRNLIDCFLKEVAS